MAEGVAEPSYPQVFVVDSQACYSPLPSSSRPPWHAWITRRLLHLFVALALLGVVIEGCFIYYLYSRTGQENPGVRNPIGYQERRVDKGSAPKPSAHLRAPLHSQMKTKENVLLWDLGERTFTSDMSYANGSLFIHKPGFYYIYSKVHFIAQDKCRSFKHKVMFRTEAYDAPLELMTSTRYHGCLTSPSRDKQDRHDTLNSYLGGAFSLAAGDAVFVIVEGRGNNDSLHTNDFMGAFMI